MKRVLVGLAMTALAVLGLAGPASAASSGPDSLRSTQRVAEADWIVATATHVTYTSVGVMRTDGITELKVELLKATVDAGGSIVSGTRTDVDVTSGFVFAIDAKTLNGALSGARTSGWHVPATTCAINADADPIEPCRSTAVDLSVTWTGIGPVNHSLFIEKHWIPGGPVTVFRTAGIDRDATARGNVGGVKLLAGNLGSAHLGLSVSTKK